MVDAAFLGAATTDWRVLAARLEQGGLLETGDARRIEHLWWFGRLIANSDMHTGNISFRPSARRLVLAPAYDMLPMLYAPLAGGELPRREFEPPLPLPPQRTVWHAACTAALGFWDRAAADVRIGEAFRAVCAANAARLRQVADRA